MRTLLHCGLTMLCLLIAVASQQVAVVGLWSETMQRAGASAGMNERLRDHYVGEYEILLSENISFDGRLVSGPGVGLLVASINETGGFLPQQQYAPLEGFNAEIAETTSTRVLDGAVRDTACIQKYGGDSLLLCRVYRRFEPAQHEIIAKCEK